MSERTRCIVAPCRLPRAHEGECYPPPDQKVSAEARTWVGAVGRCGKGRPGLITGREELPWGLSWVGIGLDDGSRWASRQPTIIAPSFADWLLRVQAEARAEKPGCEECPAECPCWSDDGYKPGPEPSRHDWWICGQHYTEAIARVQAEARAVEAEAWHERIVAWHAAIDPEAHPDVAAEMERALNECDHLLRARASQR
jgi:hypothetical protein